MKIDNTNTEILIPESLFLKYCANHDGLEAFYLKAVEKKKIGLINFNIFAILFPHIWFASRKQWKVLFFLLIIYMPVSIFFTYYLYDLPLPPLPETRTFGSLITSSKNYLFSFSALRLSWLVTKIVHYTEIFSYLLYNLIGFFAYSIILRNANREYKKLIKKGLDKEDLEFALEDKASFSLKSALIGTFVFPFLRYILLICVVVFFMFYKIITDLMFV